MGRSLKASIEGLKQAETAFKRKGWDQSYLAGASRCTRQVVGNFFARRAVEKRLFQTICSELGLEWGEIAELEAGGQLEQPLTSMDELVRTVRELIQANVEKRYGTMRVLNMEHPIGLDDIYTRVNILERIAGRRRVDIAELAKNTSHADFERFGLSNVQENRIAGIDAVEAHNKLMILGKPGAGKSTFLKHLTLQCIRGTWQIDRIPVFVTLKDFAEDTDQPGLLDYLKQIFSSYGVAPDVKLKTGVLKSLLNWNDTSVEQLLREGRLLILLDGLDEVREVDSKRVLKAIQDLANQFDQNQFVITCRIAAKEYTFEQFTEVEIADFDDDQIAFFADRWFVAKDDLVKAKRFMERLQDTYRIRELATNPLLLTLLCLVFEELGSFPRSRAELYSEGLDVLLKRWDNSRNIERDEVYKGLSSQRKEDLLSQIAWNLFEQGDYFFKKHILEDQISRYIRNLPNPSQDLQIDSEVVLKSIEAQHGLLVERARGIYSFSHLTFQEYFAARGVKERRSEVFLQTLASHITEKRWREVFLLTVGMMDNADQLLQLMKQQIDGLLAQDTKLQQFLHWVQQKSCSLEVSYKPAAVRAFYFDRALICNLALDRHRDLDGDLDSNLDRKRTLIHAFLVDLDLVIECNLDDEVDQNLIRHLIRNLSIGLSVDPSHDHIYDFAFAVERTFVGYEHYVDLAVEHERDLNRKSDPALEILLNRERDLTLEIDLVEEKIFSSIGEQLFDLEHYHNRLSYLQRDLECERELIRNLERAHLHNLKRDYLHGSVLYGKLNQVKDQLPDTSPKNRVHFTHWSQTNGQSWIEQLSTLIIEHCKVYPDWQFTNGQKSLLGQYYEANKLLVECLSSDCYVRREVREEIEATLLLPIASV